MTIPGYTQYGTNVYRAGSTVTIPGYTAYGTSLYLDGGSETIPGYTWVGDQWAAVETYSYLTSMDETLYTSGGTVRQQGNAVDDRQLYYGVQAGGSFKQVATYAATVYRSGSQITKAGDAYMSVWVRSGQATDYMITSAPKSSNIYVPDSSQARTINKRGSSPSVTLYYRDSDNDRTVTQIGSAPPYTMYYRNEDHDSTVRVVGEQLTFNYADITTQQITGVVAIS